MEIFKTATDKKNIVIYSFSIFFSLLMLYFLSGWSYFHGLDKLLHGELATSLVGFNFFKNADWVFPIGYFQSYYYPMGTYISHVDAIPIVALFFKTISVVLPSNFHYFGLWLISSYFLQMFYAQKIIEKAGLKNLYFNGVIAALFLFTPVLYYRIGHLFLCAHWLLLGLIWFYIKANESSVKKTTVYVFVFTVFAAGVSQYLSIMVLGLAIATIYKVYKLEKIVFSQWAKVVLALIATTVAMWYSFGYLSIKTEGSYMSGYGVYSANINTFFNPAYNTRSSSLFMPVLSSATHGQYEGMAYLGLGVIVLILITFIKLKSYRSIFKSYTLFPLLFVALLFFVFSLSNKIGLGDLVLLDINVSQFISNVSSFVDSTGRFVWVLYYFILAVVILVIGNQWSANKAYSILFVIVFIQCMDLSPMFAKKIIEAYPNEIASDSQLDSLIQTAEVVYMLPPYQRNYLSDDDYIGFAYLASKYNKPITTGYVRKYNQLHLNQAILDLDSIVRNEHFYFGDMLIYPLDTAPTYNYINFDYKEVRGFGIAKYHGKYKQKTGSITQFMRDFSTNKILIAISDEARSGLSNETKDYFKLLGIPLHDLQYRGSLSAVVVEGKLISYQMNDESLQSETHIEAGQFGFSKMIHVISRGKHTGAEATFKIGEKQFVNKDRGMIFAVLDKQDRLLQQVSFDTHASINDATYFALKKKE